MRTKMPIDQPKHAERTSSFAGGVAGRGGTLRVLIVDDNEIDRMSVADALKRSDADYDLDFAPSCEIAKEKLEDRIYDVILLDYQLGDGTGLDILDLHPEPPVIFVTGGGDETIAADAMKRAPRLLCRGSLKTTAPSGGAPVPTRRSSRSARSTLARNL